VKLRSPIFLLVLVLAVLLGLPVQAAEARLPSGFVGLSSEDVYVGDASYRASNLSAQAAIGVNRIRQNVHWAEIETAPGRYDLRYFDNYVAQAAAHGIRVLPVLYDPPAFRAPQRPGTTCPPSSLSAMGTFARVLVRRYGPRGSLWRERPSVRKLPITAWQIWNEPNLTQYWCNKPRARSYVRMLKVVGRAIKKSDRRAEIVTGGLPPSKLSGAVPLSSYIAQMYRAGAKRYFNTLAINSYARNHRELYSLLRSVRRLMNSRGDRRARIWITEIGWGDSGVRHRFIVGSRGQASRISKSLSLIRHQRRRLRLRGFVYYRWRDGRPYAPSFRDMWGLHTGLLTVDGQRKPAYDAFKNAVRRFR
jgi:polysaccharide biosynthesis protein PslG